MFCFFANKNPLTYERLKIFASTSDGFQLAERDLAIRGPGEIFGTLQSGLGELRVATFADKDIALSARRAARDLAESDRKLTTVPAIALKLKEIEKAVHLE